MTVHIFILDFSFSHSHSESFSQAGLPSGVLNVVSGFGPTAGAALASHMEVDKVLYIL